ncbi:thiopurine S-methyltransferase [Kangiella marina]|uniref:thiopurine S-methyltransferase n=1 Tax=Kangiella marina TaxID=1079178 RepID=A0ABP8IEB8_9GAMM
MASDLFHLTAPHHFLVEQFESYFSDQKKVLLPLCGKTLDLNFLASQGINAVGVEFNPKAVESFFTDSGLAPNIEQASSKTHYSAPNIDLWCADFFELKVEDTGGFERIFDRAALVALPEELRTDYAAHLLSFLKPKGHILLVTMSYDQNEMSGPPFFVGLAEIERLFPNSSIKELNRISILDSHPRWRELQLSRLDEVLYDIHLD